MRNRCSADPKSPIPGSHLAISHAGLVGGENWRPPKTCSTPGQARCPGRGAGRQYYSLCGWLTARHPHKARRYPLSCRPSTPPTWSPEPRLLSPLFPTMTYPRLILASYKALGARHFRTNRSAVYKKRITKVGASWPKECLAPVLRADFKKPSSTRCWTL